MCVGIPMQVQSCAGSFAECVDHAGQAQRVDMLLVGDQPPGTWLMTFMGAARAVIDADEAARTASALHALQGLLNGDVVDLDAAFADLIERGPQLPDFLKGQA